MTSRRLYSRDYNERLFSGRGLRSFVHLARYRWVKQKFSLYFNGTAPGRVLELGCYDGKLLDQLGALSPEEYVGFDAGWEGGLDKARLTWGKNGKYEFIESKDFSAFDRHVSGTFTAAVSMETLEHIPPDAVPCYLKRIADVTDGYFFVTVPNEKGLFLLAKQLAKKFCTKEGSKYTWKELFWGSVGRLGKIERDEHKGFDWESLVDQMKEWFEIIEVEGRPLRFLPACLCFSICIVARPRR